MAGKQSDRRPSLNDRYRVEDGRLFLTGNQALVRMLIEQMRSDQAAGIRSRAFVTGYPGSPLGSIDLALKQASKYLAEFGITHLPAQNEEFAASSLMGTQMLDEHPHDDVDGVVGYWYGKGPGLDRAGDALKHGNFAGTSKNGAVVILSGEDHEAKSSTVPYQQEFAFEHHGIPVLYPADIQEFLDFGLHAAALSRFSGCWVALKLVGTLCDGGEVVQVHRQGIAIETPHVQTAAGPFVKVANHRFFPVVNVETERKLYEERHAAVLAYARANSINKIMASSPDDEIGIISAGKSWSDTLQALHDLGLSHATSTSRIRLAKVGLVCPLDKEFIKQFAHGLKTVIVIEEKRDFLERQVAAAAIGTSVIEVLGKTSRNGKALFPTHGGMNSDLIADRLAAILGLTIQSQAVSAPTVDKGDEPRMNRTPNYCSGCPHNTSTLLAPGQMAWGAPGCHLFAALMDNPQKRVEATTQLGGEGLPWVGLSPYTSRSHIVQNLGDGALFHSSYQNIRYAVTTGINITFKILFNGVLANTGGQDAVSTATIADLLTHLALDKVVRIVLISKEPERYLDVKLPAIVEQREVSQLESTMAELASVPGVTILLYDGICANERRRRQKRGLLPAPTKFTFVNEDVCENCGDCGVKANCMSLQKVDTEFGPKTQIHQSSCNQDQACVVGECPSFVTVEVDDGVSLKKPSRAELDTSWLPEPVYEPITRTYSIYIPGLGGTGVLTASAMLAQAAALDGLEVKTYDQTGAAQKWGPVLSSLVLAPHGAVPLTNTVGRAKADLYLALDLLAAVEPANLARCDMRRTKAVINVDVLPNGEMIRDVRIKPPIDEMRNRVAASTNGDAALAIDARQISEALLGDYLMTNMVAIGAAYQAGWLPISGASIKTAIELNGVQVQANLLAFDAGRMWQCDPQRMSVMMKPRSPLLANRINPTPSLSVSRALNDIYSANAAISASTKDIISKRFADLVDYQGLRYAHRYIDTVLRVADTERNVTHSPEETLIKTVARNLHALMAYKDEYEVARLLTCESFEQRLRESFNGPVRIKYNLQPPLGRRLGISRKVRLGPWFRPLMVVLARLKFLRGTPFDPFARLPSRCEERELIHWYLTLVDIALPLLRRDNIRKINELLSLPEDIRGFERVKSEAVEKAKQRARKLLSSLAPAHDKPPRRATLELA